MWLSVRAENLRGLIVAASGVALLMEALRCHPAHGLTALLASGALFDLGVDGACLRGGRASRKGRLAACLGRRGDSP